MRELTSSVLFPVYNPSVNVGFGSQKETVKWKLEWTVMLSYKIFFQTLVLPFTIYVALVKFLNHPGPWVYVKRRFLHGIVLLLEWDDKCKNTWQMVANKLKFKKWVLMYCWKILNIKDVSKDKLI